MPSGQTLSQEFLISLVTSRTSPTTATPLPNGKAFREQVKIVHTEDVTNDGYPEIVVEAREIPPDATIPDIWLHLLFLTCIRGKYEPIYTRSFQDSYQQYKFAVLPDSNGNALPEIQLITINTHLDVFTVTEELEWDGRELRTISQESATPTP